LLPREGRFTLGLFLFGLTVGLALLAQRPWSPAGAPGLAQLAQLLLRQLYGPAAGSPAQRLLDLLANHRVA
jgi:hypothetical protein